MCGIAGIVGIHEREHIDAMIDALSHRGPDGRGIWNGEGASMGAHRLAIVDRANGHQPFIDGSLILVCNGEIYNHERIRNELRTMGARFSTRCDVEVILHGYRIWGVDVLNKLNGQFAFAIWDTDRRELLIARDRFGIVPLVWTKRGGRFSFASEVKALLTQTNLRAELSPGALDDFLAMRYAGEPGTFFQGIFHLMPGHFMKVKDGEPEEPKRWYKPRRSGEANGATPNIGEATDELFSLLERAVSRRRQGEVPIGIYLSGGVDSSVVGSIASKGEGPLLAFSHGFDDRHDELKNARAANQTIGGEMHEVLLKPSDFDSLGDIIRATEQPVANSDIIGLWALARKAQEDVPVVLCGEGADEIFGSYPHQQLLNRLALLSPRLRKAGAQILSLTPSFVRNKLGPYAGALRDADGMHRLLTALRADSLSNRYNALTSLFTYEERQALYTEDLSFATANIPGMRQTMLDELQEVEPEQILDQLIDLKMKHWLSGYHLGRENRIAMAHGVEARYPFLDHDVVEFVLSLPFYFKIGGPKPREKRVLRRVAARLLPPEQARNPKGPVRVPLSLFGDRFPSMCATYLSPERVRHRGLFRPEAVSSLIERMEHAPFWAGRQVFALLMIELWHEAFEA